ncbi:hypothetical protein Sjap_011450 [Stephania japonica]|uniref:Uncharacterized protein n=1 Tax=Stephania japonica TaxID=461633 RepID=A0AAP0JBI6_9MAGN
MLVKVTIRFFVSKELEICRGSSDYKWSTRPIVASQVITVFIGCLGTAFRLITMAEHVQGDDIKYVCEDFDDDSSWVRHRVAATFLCPAILIAMLIEGLTIAPYAFIAKLVKGCREARKSDDRGCFNICKPNDEDGATKEFKDSVQAGEMGLDDWTLVRGVKDMKRWIDSVNKIKSSNHLCKLLSETPPSQDSLAFRLQNQSDPAEQRVSKTRHRLIPDSRNVGSQRVRVSFF